MNTTCKFWYDDDDGGRACAEPTKHGRTHCHVHRAEEIRRLSKIKNDRRRAYEVAEQMFNAYFSEGDPL